LENDSDKHIWEYAKQQTYTIVTFDADFYDFSLVWGQPPKIIWIRSYNQTTQNIEKIIRKYSKTMIEFQYDITLACLEIIDLS
jgi:predicted nuclease of predicted toxin-antitoxin system